MLVLSRKVNESIILNDNIRITLLGIRGNQIRLGIEAPANVTVLREELARRNRSESETLPEASANSRPAVNRMEIEVPLSAVKC